MWKSQIGQDQWVISVLGESTDGFFVEVGASDGVEYSNTYYMEKVLGWKGICIEPHPDLYQKLSQNRECHLSNALVYEKAGESLSFQLNGMLSGIVNESSGGMMRKWTGPNIRKTTTTLDAVLKEFKAPKVIDYLSLDVEGNEYNILKTFPFGEYTFRCLTVEHNEPHQGPELRNRLRRLLEQHGYIFVKGNDDLRGWGHGPIDDFYKHKTLLPLK